jgi:hypothetical protein
MNENQSREQYEFQLNGAKLSSGIYFCTLITGFHAEVMKMILLK